MVPTVAFVFKTSRPITFFAVKKVSFSESRKFSTVKEIFHNQGNFPQSKSFLQTKIKKVLQKLKF